LAYETGFEVEFSTNRVNFSKVATVGPDITKAKVSIPIRRISISTPTIIQRMSGFQETVDVNAPSVANLTKAEGKGSSKSQIPSCKTPISNGRPVGRLRSPALKEPNHPFW
jgi:hypothetical protein